MFNIALRVGSEVAARKDLKRTNDVRIRLGTPGKIVAASGGKFTVEFVPPGADGTVVRIPGLGSGDIRDPRA